MLVYSAAAVVYVFVSCVFIKGRGIIALRFTRLELE